MILLITSIIAITLKAGTSLVFATIGEIYTEKSGILNLGIEGIMLMAAVMSFTVSYYTGSLFAAVLTAMLTGGILSLLHAFFINNDACTAGCERLKHHSLRDRHGQLSWTDTWTGIKQRIYDWFECGKIQDYCYTGIV